jgi:hypothetical protein
MAEKEQDLKVNRILEEIRNKARLEDELKEEIRLEKMTISRMGMRNKKGKSSKKQSQHHNAENYVTEPLQLTHLPV